MTQLLQRLQYFLLKAEEYLLVGLVFFSVLLSCLQILLRNLFDSGILWADSALRILVLWLGMIGAMYASHKNKHIRIDLFSRYVSVNVQRALWVLTELLSAVVCFIAAWYSAQFVHFEYLDGTIAFASVPSWLCALVIPFAFTIMGLRFLLACLPGEHQVTP